MHYVKYKQDSYKTNGRACLIKIHKLFDINLLTNELFSFNIFITNKRF